jgi:hypothetical protein
MKLVRKNHTQTKETNTIQNRTDIQMSILQSAKANIVHNMKIQQYNTNHNRNNLLKYLSLLNSKNSITE